MLTGQLNSYWSKAVRHRQARAGFHVALIRKHVAPKLYNSRSNFENDLAKFMCNSWESENKPNALSTNPRV